MNPTNPTELDRSRLRSLVAKCVEAVEAGAADPVPAVCAETPALESEVRKRLQRLRDLGLLAAETPELPSFGDYEVVRRLGAGGMGAVFLAEQRAPVRRQVALKVIKLGMDSAAILKRFEIERQALAAMDHDAIARIYDAGVTDRGQPFFSMEYVDGVAITEHCDRHGLSVRGRIELFQAVCAGVQHAHQKGVVHRDLKPSNVLVRQQGERAQPKIIDFGLARAIDRDSVRQTLFTELGQVVGTPEYMAPEQADPGSSGVDTRSDVYSLGVMLYELLTGSVPRAARDGDARRPSTVTTTSAASRALRGDLDWIVLRAMAWDPERRYASAAELGHDLQRHLDGDPVLAGPPSTGYRLRKLLGRYRVVVGAAALVLTVAVVSAIGLLVAFNRASRDAENARTSLGLAVEAVDTLLVRNAEERLRGVPNANPIILESLRDALALYEKLLARSPDDLDLQLKYVAAKLRLGAILTGWRGDDHVEGRAALDDVAARLDRMRAAHPADARVAREQAKLALHSVTSLVVRGERDTALARWQRAVDDLHAFPEPETSLLADLMQMRANWALYENDFETALTTATESLRQRRELVARQPDDDSRKTELARALNQMVALHGRRRSVDDAVPYAREACAIVDELASRHTHEEYYRQDQATAWSMRAELERDTGDLETSETSARRALELYDALIADHPDKLLYPYGAGTTQMTLAKVLLASGRVGSATEMLRDGLRRSAALRAQSPNDPRFRELRVWQLRALLGAVDSESAEAAELRRELEELGGPGGGGG